MFSRSSSYVLSTFKAELKKSGVRYTAQSKKNRIDVQLLKDFPGVGVKGQIVSVKASTMSNQLYPYNGAVYMNYKGAQNAIPVVTRQAAAAAAAALKSAQLQEKKQRKVKLNPIIKNEVEMAKQRGEALLSLDDLLAIDLNTLTQQEEDLVFSKIPKNLVFVKKSKDKVLASPLKKSFIIQQIELALSKYINESDITAKFFNGKETSFEVKSDEGEYLESIDKLGAYYVQVKHKDREQLISIIVNSK
jgi:hypothetical protein